MLDGKRGVKVKQAEHVAKESVQKGLSPLSIHAFCISTFFEVDHERKVKAQDSNQYVPKLPAG